MLASVLVMPMKAQTLTADGRVLVSTNGGNFDISVFPGQAMYNDGGNGAVTLTNMLGDGTVLDYKFVGNAGTGSPLAVYAEGSLGLIADPVAPSGNVHGNGEDWANVWTASDPGTDFLLNAKDHNPTGNPEAANTFARAAEVDGTIDITALAEGTVYFPHGTYINNWTITVTMSGPGQTDIVASETQGGNGAGTNFGWISGFSFAGAENYTTLTYNYTNGDRDGSRARFMGVILDGPLQSGATFIELAGDDPQTVERATAWSDPGVSALLDKDSQPLDASEVALITVDSSALDLTTPGEYPVVYNYPGNGPLLPSSKTRTVTVIDTQAPTVQLVGDASITITAGTPFVDPGATGQDANDNASTPIYSSASAPASSQATGKWTFDDDSINDSSGNGYNGTAQGTMTYSTDTPYGAGKSIDFSGGNNAFFVDDGTANQSAFEPTPFFRTPAPTDPTLVGQWTVESTGPGVTTDASVTDFIGTSAEIDAAVANDGAAAISMWDNINFGDGNNGRIGGDSFYPRAVNNNPEQIAIRATGMLHIPVDGDYDIGFQSDDGSTLVIEGTGAAFQLPLLESGGGGRVIQQFVSSPSVDNLGSLGAAADLGNAPLSTNPFLDGGDGGFPLLEQAGALVDPTVPGPEFSNNAMLFAGENLDVPHNSAFNVEDSDVASAINGTTGVATPGAASEISVEFWAKPSGNGNLLCPINNLVFSGSARKGWLFYQTPDDSWEWRVGDDAGYIDPVRGNAGDFADTYDQWNHVVGVLRLDKTDPSNPVYTSELYVDGQLANSAVLSRIPLINDFVTTGGTPSTVRLGATNQNADLAPGREYLGALDEVAIYDTALSAAQIQAHYENGVNAPARTTAYPDAIVADAPLGYWRGEEAQPTVDPNPAVTGLFAPANGGDQRAVGRITLTAGDYPIKFISRERGGGEYCEVFAKAAASESYDPLSFGGFTGYPSDTPLTISFFAKRNGWAGNWSAMVTKRGEGGQGWQVRRRGGEDKVVFTTRGLGNDDATQGSITSVPDGQWHHIVAEYGGSGGNRKLWIDGVLDYDITSSGLMNPAPGFNFAVGAIDNNPAPGPNLGNFFQGMMDNVCVFHRTLSDGERFGLLAGGDRVDTNSPGTYTVRYVSIDGSGNSAFTTREVIVEPNLAAPVITLIDGNDITIEASLDPFVDPGATVAEGPGGTNPGAPLDANEIVVSGDTVDTSTPGLYRLYYDYSDGTNGSALQVERLVRVVDNTGPVITLNGPETIMLNEGDEFLDPGATASDIVSGSLTAFASELPGQTLLGRWTFDDPADPGKDSSGMGRPVSLENGAVRSAVNPAVGDGFLDCVGGSRYATVRGGSTANDLYEMGSGSFTVSAWVRGWPDGSWEPFLGKRGEGGQGWQLRRYSGSTNATITTRGAGADDSPTDSAVPQDGQWHHIVGRVDRDTNTKTVFVDGVQVGGTATLNGNPINAATNHALTLSARDNGGYSIGNHASVALDDVQLYRTALTDAQIADLANPLGGVDYIPNRPAEGEYTITYTAVDGSGNTATTTRNLVVGPPIVDYDEWAALFPGADLTDPDADLDGDGFTNDEERLFGLDPTDPSSVNPYTVALEPGTGTFSFTRRDPSLTGLFTHIETSSDLQNWTIDGGATLVVTGTDANGTQTVAVTLSPGLLTAPDLYLRVNQNDGVLLSENFESGDGGFTVDTTEGTDWVLGAPNSVGLGGAVTEGNGGSSNAWGTGLGDGSNPSGLYVDPTTTKLRSPVIDLTGAAGAELSFAQALDIEGGDTAVVNVIEAGSGTVIAPAIFTASDGDINTANWSAVGPISLTPYVGQQIRLEWSFNGLGGTTDDFMGWYIDDVSVNQTMAP